MSANAISRGHEIVFRDGEWVYADTGQPDDGKRPCKRCGRPPTPEGHDACLGHLPGVEWACCGHGVREPYASIKGKAIDISEKAGTS